MIALALRYWQPILGVIAAAVIFGAVKYYGHGRYQAGQEAERAIWTQQLVKAERAKAEADARAATIEHAQKAAVAAQEARHAAQLQAIDSRARDYQHRYARLVRELAEHSRGDEMPAVPIGSPEPHGAAGSDGHALATGERLADIGGRCERDAARLAGWQQWYAEQSALAR